MNVSRMLKAALPLMLLSLTACSILSPTQRDPVTVYAPEVRITPDPAWPKVDWQLAVLKPSAARVVDSPRINVRPVPGELQVYRGVIWSQSATELVEGAVLRTFEDSGRIAAVARPSAGIRADYRLLMDLRRFESDYAGQTLPLATIEISAMLMDSRDQRVVASRTFLAQKPAATTDTAQVAAAFEQSLASITREIVGWTLESGQQDRLRER